MLFRSFVQFQKNVTMECGQQNLRREHVPLGKPLVYISACLYMCTNTKSCIDVCTYVYRLLHFLVLEEDHRQADKIGGAPLPSTQEPKGEIVHQLNFHMRHKVVQYARPLLSFIVKILHGCLIYGIYFLLLTRYQRSCFTDQLSQWLCLWLINAIQWDMYSQLNYKVTYNTVMQMMTNLLFCTIHCTYTSVYDLRCIIMLIVDQAGHMEYTVYCYSL